MARSNYLKESEWHMNGEKTSELACDLDLIDVYHVSDQSYLVNSCTHVEVYEEHDHAEIGIQKRDMKVNDCQVQIAMREHNINLGGSRRDDEPIPESYWDHDDPDDDTLDTEIEEDDE